ncbi:hypothetical protein CPELA_03525 [Corynebacterium pelargi]|uniref:Uncharacterized protein n=1 Tax=Corynebacterium pelargi TaxID=1471400 RepID=A0A410W7Q9_9CORY|nr:hypothetical protein CPELA_03525 [Corynebacterium pelargi]
MLFDVPLPPTPQRPPWSYCHKPCIAPPRGCRIALTYTVEVGSAFLECLKTVHWLQNLGLKREKMAKSKAIYPRVTSRMQAICAKLSFTC